MPSKYPQSVKSELRRALEHEREMLREIANAQATGSGRRAENAQRLYLGSYDAKLVAACRASQSYRLDRRPPASMIIETARKVNVWRPCAERVKLRLKEKKTPGTYRRIYDFGLENRTRQHLVTACLKPRVALHPHQFASSGGTHAAVKAVCEAILAGNRHVGQADIDNYYGSVSVKKLPLPKAIIQTVVLAKNLNLWPGWVGDQQHLEKEVNKLNADLASPEDDPAPHGDPHLLPHICISPDEFPPALDEALGGHLAMGRLGIPAGSPCSSLVAEALLTSTVEQISDCGVIVQYADDFMVLGTSKEEAALNLQTLRTALKSHPAGPFSVKENKYQPGEPLDFLGFRLTPTSSQVLITPAERNLRTFQRTFKAARGRILKAQSEKERNELVEKVRFFVRGWCAAFSIWPGAAEYRNQHLSLIEELAK